MPVSLLDDLRRLVPRSRRSEVIARATARELRRLKLAAQLQNLEREPIWRGQDYRLPDGPTVEHELDRLRGRGIQALAPQKKRQSRRG